ncbi:hypothetical protein CANMA_003292 [Candida margitis]|uniref:uncharacterized protein n=1 Tax=Candida margitis TaxID=1775924 RepID=UPI00222613A0|nr:uncharacterized protein CANMA_003292 [Candida margitis]KAI5966046.1 hypothetical protein CANMA_003292 [Candida margitis]
MFTKSSTYQPLRRSIMTHTRRQFSQVTVLSQPQYRQQFPQSQGNSYNYLSYFQSKSNATTGYNNDGDVNRTTTSCSDGSSTTSSNSSRAEAAEEEASWHYVDLVHPHVAEFADLF